MGVVALARKDGNEALAKRQLHRGQDALLVVDHHVAVRRVAALHGVEHLLLVDVDQHASPDSVPKARTLNLARLKDDIAVGQDDGLAEPVESREHVERPGIKTISERIVDQEGRQRQQPVSGVVVGLDIGTVTLQGAQVVRVSQFVAQSLEDGPVAIRVRDAEFALEMLAQVGDDPVVVEKRVVNVEQEDERRGHVVLPTTAGTAPVRFSGSYQPPSPAISASAAAGPQVPGA